MTPTAHVDDMLNEMRLVCWVSATTTHVLRAKVPSDWHTGASVKGHEGTALRSGLNEDMPVENGLAVHETDC